jgi:hypothetical protein
VAVTGQMVVEMAMVSVTVLGRVGQLVTSGGHWVMVRTEVVKMVEVLN